MPLRRRAMPLQNVLALTKRVLEHRINESELPKSVSEHRINAITLRKNVFALTKRAVERRINEVKATKRAVEPSNSADRPSGPLGIASAQVVFARTFFRKTYA
jgi:hypothetical protein